MTGRPESIVSELLVRHGRLYAEDAGIKLADRPGPLYQLLVMATLLSAPIPAETAVAAARELFAAGYLRQGGMQLERRAPRSAHRAAA